MNCVLKLRTVSLWIVQHMKSVDRNVDQESVTMGDYTVEIKPVNDEEWSDFR